MKTEELRKILIEEQYLNKWSEKYNFEAIDYTWNEDGSVDVNGSLTISDNMSELPFKLGKLTGYFYADYIGLKTLKNCPTTVGEFFSVEGNCLDSLLFSPIEVEGVFYCRENPVNFTEEDVRKVCKVDNIFGLEQKHKINLRHKRLINYEIQ